MKDPTTPPPSKPELDLDRVEAHVKTQLHPYSGAVLVYANGADVLALLEEAREYRRLKSALEFLAGDSDLFDLWREDDGYHAETPHGLHGVTASEAPVALLHHCQRRGWKETP